MASNLVVIVCLLRCGEVSDELPEGLSELSEVSLRVT